MLCHNSLTYKNRIVDYGYIKDNRLYIRNSLFENSNDKFDDVRDQLELLKDFSAIGFKFVSFPKLKNVKY